MTLFASQILPSFRAIAETSAPLAITAIWQGIAVTAAVGLCLKLAPRVTAAHRFVVWFTAFGVLVALPFLPRHSGPASQGPALSALPSTAGPGPILHFGVGWSLAIVALWLLTSVFRAADLLLHSVRLRKLWRTATPVPASDTPALQRSFTLCTTEHLDRPSVIGFFAPRILIPDWLSARLTQGELRQIVLHESEHLRRRDDWTNLLQKLCLVLFPLNPALWWIDRCLAKEREMACDEGVIRITRAPRAYAACLASLAERGLNHRTAAALSLGAWQRRPELAHRVHSLLRTQRSLHPIAARSFVAAFSAALLLAAFELARCPQLVAFTAPPTPVPTETLAASLAHAQPPHLVDAAVTVAPCRNRLVAPYRAVAAVAHMPATPTPVRVLSERRPSSIRVAPATAHMDPPQQERIVRTSAMQTTDPSTGAQYIVYAEFEQVETTAARNTLTADYDKPSSAGSVAQTQKPGDLSAPSLQKSAASAQSNAQPATHSTVTHLIFRVVPAVAPSSQPTAIPIGDGWFVIQL